MKKAGQLIQSFYATKKILDFSEIPPWREIRVTVGIFKILDAWVYETATQVIFRKIEEKYQSSEYQTEGEDNGNNSSSS